MPSAIIWKLCMNFLSYLYTEVVKLCYIIQRVWMSWAIRMRFWCQRKDFWSYGWRDIVVWNAQEVQSDAGLAVCIYWSVLLCKMTWNVWWIGFCCNSCWNNWERDGTIDNSKLGDKPHVEAMLWEWNEWNFLPLPPLYCFSSLDPFLFAQKSAS